MFMFMRTIRHERVYSWNGVTIEVIAYIAVGMYVIVYYAWQ